MKLDAIETFVVGNPPPKRGGNYFLFVKLTTACGIVGYGEIYTASFGGHTVATMAEDVFNREMLGEDPFQIEKMWRRVYSRGFSSRPDISLMGVMSGLEMACWDIIGKACDKPVHALIGGKLHERLRSYTYIYPDEGMDEAAFYNDPDTSAEMAARYVKEGFDAVKFDPAGAYTPLDPHMPSLEDIDRSERFLKAMREAVGNDADLLFGTHGQFSVSGAKRMARMMEKYDPLWFEEPTPPERPEMMAQVAAATNIPIATGERLTTKYEFIRVLEQGAANIIQMNLGRVGGILEAKKVAALAESYYAHIAPHLYCGPIVGAANIQLSATCPNFLILESIRKWDGFYADILTQPILWEDGHVIVPDRPGLGVELNEDLARAHPWEGDALHLNTVDHWDLRER
ncbi:MAG: mandelate racemase/muconate lactonizing enzyme family protein [Alphaproteobacteria bacterium]|nr:mandelate racemase/muconate lactonizing enzyme family protein [Alphaproteobacteria bacterium]